MIDKRGFGAQSFAILPKIREWDELLQADDRARAVVREIHPEVSFAALNGGRGHGLRARKKLPEGAMLRSELLSASFGSGPVQDLISSVSRRQAATDDVLDALVALWSGQRIQSGLAGTLPIHPETDAVGLTSAIWY